MNLYLVISEMLEGVEIIDPELGGPKVSYAIAEIVAAETPAKARWAAWKTDSGNHGSFTGDIRDMPRFRVRKAGRNLDIPAGIYTDDERFQGCWEVDAESTP